MSEQCLSVLTLHFLHDTWYHQVFVFAGVIDVKWYLIVVLVCCYHIILILKIETLMYNRI